MEAEFQFVAMVLDRIFMIIYVLAVVVGSLGILLISPVIWEKDDVHRAPTRIQREDVIDLEIKNTTTTTSTGNAIMSGQLTVFIVFLHALSKLYNSLRCRWWMSSYVYG